MIWLESTLPAVAGNCGAIGQRLAGVNRAGCLGTIAVGFIGTLPGIWIAGGLRLPEILAFRRS